MADSLDPKELVARVSMLEIAALVEARERKGTLTRKEIYAATSLP